MALSEIFGHGSPTRSYDPLRTASKMAVSVCAQNGGTPDSGMYRITPALQMSASHE